MELDLKVDPPPDLAVEAVVSHGPKQALEIYRRLGVPEVWVCTSRALTIFRIGEDGTYAVTAESHALPTLRAEEIFDWADQPLFTNDRRGPIGSTIGSATSWPPESGAGTNNIARSDHRDSPTPALRAVGTRGRPQQRSLALATATMTPEPTAVSTAIVDHTVDLHEIDWEGFQTILRLRGDRSAPGFPTSTGP